MPLRYRATVLLDYPAPLCPYGSNYRSVYGLQWYLAHKNPPPLWYHHRSLGIGLLQGSTRGVFLMNEVPLHPPSGYSRNRVVVRCTGKNRRVESLPNPSTLEQKNMQV